MSETIFGREARKIKFRRWSRGTLLFWLKYISIQLWLIMLCLGFRKWRWNVGSGWRKWAWSIACANGCYGRRKEICGRIVGGLWIAEEDFDTQNLTIRSIFHLFYIDEENIFKSGSAFDTPKHSKMTVSLTALYFLLTGNDLSDRVPEESKEEREKES